MPPIETAAVRESGRTRKPRYPDTPKPTPKQEQGLSLTRQQRIRLNALALLYNTTVSKLVGSWVEEKSRGLRLSLPGLRPLEDSDDGGIEANPAVETLPVGQTLNPDPLELEGVATGEGERPEPTGTDTALAIVRAKRKAQTVGRTG
jgi:hypothetical protein